MPALFSTFDLKKVTYRFVPKKTTPSKSKIPPRQVVYLDYPAPFRMQLVPLPSLKAPNPEIKCLSCPFGISLFGKEGNALLENGARQNMNYAVNNPDLVRFVSDLDEQNIQAGIKNRATWFGPEFDEKKVRQAYTKSVNIEKAEYLPSLRTKVDINPEEKKNYVDIRVAEQTDKGLWVLRNGRPTDVEKGCKLIPTVQPKSLWFMSNKLNGIQNISWGMNLQTTSALVFRYPQVVKDEYVSEDGSLPTMTEEGGENSTPSTSSTPSTELTPSLSLSLSSNEVSASQTKVDETPPQQDSGLRSPHKRPRGENVTENVLPVDKRQK